MNARQIVHEVSSGWSLSTWSQVAAIIFPLVAGGWIGIGALLDRFHQQEVRDADQSRQIAVLDQKVTAMATTIERFLAERHASR